MMHRRQPEKFHDCTQAHGYPNCSSSAAIEPTVQNEKEGDDDDELSPAFYDASDWPDWLLFAPHALEKPCEIDAAAGCVAETVLHSVVHTARLDACTLATLVCTSRALRLSVAQLLPHITGSLPSAADTSNWHWCGGSASEWVNVRSSGYLSTSRGCKERCSSQALSCLAVDELQFESDAHHISRGVALHKQSFLARERVARKATGFPPHFTICIAFQNPDGVCILLFFREEGVGLNELCDPGRRGGKAFKRFVAAHEYEQGKRFKLIQRLQSAPRAVRSCVPAEKPLLLGSNICTRVSRLSDDVLEIALPIGSSSFVSRMYRAIVRFAGSVDVELCFLVESKYEDELPEGVLGSCRLRYVSKQLAQPVDA